MYEYVLEWKDFKVKLGKMHDFLKENLSDYDGMVADPDNLKVILTTYNEADIIRIDDYWESVTEQTESQMNQEELQEMYKEIVSKAIKFGNDLVIEFASENIMMGITQAGKTKDVADYTADVMRYIQSGSLYEVIHEVDRLINEGIPQELSPFVTDQRMISFKNKILEYLNG